MASRPYFNTPGAQLVELILAGDKAAITEAKKYRTTRQVKAALAKVKAAPKATSKRLHVAGTGKAVTAGHTQARKGPNPHTQAANASGHTAGSSEWWATYKAHSAASRQLVSA